MTELPPEQLRHAHKYRMLEERLKIKERAIQVLLSECGKLRAEMIAAENEMHRGFKIQ
jgi:hypothetical protein